jgi:hypothetical protein
MFSNGVKIEVPTTTTTTRLQAFPATIVAGPTELANAFRQRDARVEVQDPRMVVQFGRLAEWREARNWFYAVAGAALLAYALSLQYKIDASFEHDWKTEKSGATIIFTPKNK